MTVRQGSSSGTVISGGSIIEWSQSTPFYAVCSQTNGNGKYLVKSYVMSSAPAFNSSDINNLVTGAAYNGYFYGATGNDVLDQSIMNELPFEFSSCSIGQYVKIWIAAEDANYSTNNYVNGIQFAIKLTGSTPVVIHPSSSLAEKFSTLSNKLSTGSYWSWGGTAVSITYGSTSLTTYVSSTSKCSHSSDTLSSTCQAFGFTNGKPSCKQGPSSSWGSKQCAGYARLIGWAISGRDPYSDSYKQTANDSNRTTLVNNLAPGDIIRVGADRHSMVVVDTDDTYIYVTDCNWDHKCGIRWNASFTRTALSSNGETGSGQAGRNRLCHVYKYSLYGN